MLSRLGFGVCTPRCRPASCVRGDGQTNGHTEWSKSTALAVRPQPHMSGRHPASPRCRTGAARWLCNSPRAPLPSHLGATGVRSSSIDPGMAHSEHVKHDKRPRNSTYSIRSVHLRMASVGGITSHAQRESAQQPPRSEHPIASDGRSPRPGCRLLPPGARRWCGLLTSCVRGPQSSIDGSGKAPPRLTAISAPSPTLPRRGGGSLSATTAARCGLALRWLSRSRVVD